MGIGEGEYDFGFLMGCVESNEVKMVTVETPRTTQLSLDGDFENRERLCFAMNKYYKVRLK